MIHQGLDQVAAAINCYERFLALAPEGDTANDIRDAAGRLRTRLN